MPIKIVKNTKESKKIKPYYKLVYNYMIGDADGETRKSAKISVDNPFVERYVKLLNSLESLEGCWGVMLTPEDIYKSFKEKQITEDDYLFLMRLMFVEDEEFDDDDEAENKADDSSKIANYFKTEKENKFADQFSDGVEGYTEYSFLVFEGLDLFYYDENNQKNKTEIK